MKLLVICLVVASFLPLFAKPSYVGFLLSNSQDEYLKKSKTYFTAEAARLGAKVPLASAQNNEPTQFDRKTDHIGSIMRGNSANPEPNTPEGWAAMVENSQTIAISDLLGIPLLHGVDAVPGHKNVKSTTIFLHNIGLGANRNPDLVRRIGEITAIEMAATGMNCNVSPYLGGARDVRSA